MRAWEVTRNLKSFYHAFSVSVGEGCFNAESNSRPLFLSCISWQDWRELLKVGGHLSLK
uniref:Uncharacterized protein n=1 Tax=Rhizophora mucronata TaxID=61149 RepID=A0A2P2PWG4_RHIMU